MTETPDANVVIPFSLPIKKRVPVATPKYKGLAASEKVVHLRQRHLSDLQADVVERGCPRISGSRLDGFPLSRDLNSLQTC